MNPKKFFVTGASTILFLAGLVSFLPAQEDPYGSLKNLSLGMAVRSNNHIYEFTASKAVDGDVLTYFEGAAKKYPNEITVDLGSVKRILALRLKLNPKRIWQARKQEIEILTSNDGTGFTSILAAAGYAFDPVSSRNEVTIPFAAEARFVRLSFTSNTGATGGQVAEFEILGE